MSVDKEALDMLDERPDTDIPEVAETSADDLAFPAPIEQVEGSVYEEDAKEKEALDQLDGANVSKSKPSYMESVEEWEEGHDYPEDGAAPDDEDIEGAGELVAGLVGNAKTFINRYFKREYRKRIDAEFPKEKMQLLKLVMFLEKQDEMNSQNIEKMKEFAEIYKVSLPEMISAYMSYVEIKEELQAGAYEEWQKEGIKKYTQKCVRKYFVNQAPDPALMLGLYIATTLGMDVGKIVMHRMDSK